MKKVLLTFILLTSVLIFAQESSGEKFQVGLQYNQFFDKQDAVSINYNGIIGLNGRYKVISFGVIDLNAGLTLSYFQSRYDVETEEYTDAININPNVVFELNTNSGFKPFIGLGYNFFNSKWKAKDNPFGYFDPADPAFQGGEISEKVRLSGFNLNAGTRYHFSKLFYAELSYNYMNVKTSGDNFGLGAISDFISVDNFSYYNTEKTTSLHLFNIGLGVRF